MLKRQLVRMGFDVTTVLGSDAKKATIETKLREFSKKTEDLSKSDVVVVAFSGHGQQLVTEVNGSREEVPFFCPYDAIGKRADKLLSLNKVVSSVGESSGSLHNLILIDACRDNPAKGVDGSFAAQIPQGVSILFAAKSGEKSWESSDDSIKH